MTFEYCIEKVGLNEGGFSTDRSDRGNWSSGKVGVGEFKGSKYGISAMSYPHLDIKNLTWPQAKEIYLKDFWNKYRIGELAPWIRLYVLDSIINHGGSGGIKLLQRVCSLKQDGIVGSATIAASKRVSAWTFAEVRAKYYVEISQNGFNDENDRKQLGGWVVRNIHVLRDSINWQAAA